MSEEINNNATNNQDLVERYFTKPGVSPFDLIDWEFDNISIADDKGATLWVQKNVEFPKFWSGLSRKVVASRYFYGRKDTSDRENSVKQLIGRVAGTFSKWALKQNYFDTPDKAKAFGDELSFITLNQMGSFNSPVWFNVGTDVYPSRNTRGKKEGFVIVNKLAVPIPDNTEHLFPQTSACFIQSVDDTMESILELSKKEGLLFKHGSGTGTDLSTLRSSRELLSTGGRPSGPLAYLQFYDKVAQIVKSGGKTRRAAKMNSMMDWHPDIREFIFAKMREQEKLEMLMDQGIPYHEAEETVSYQNENLSVRVTDKFMNSVLNDDEWRTIPVHSKDLADEMPVYQAKKLMREIAECAHGCADPGLQFHTTINKWHTCPNSDIIRASNPCSEYMFLDDSSCNLLSLNLLRFLKDINGKEFFDTKSFIAASRVTAIAQDLEFDNSQYPSKEIAQNSHDYRPLGQGHANIGALLMSLGVPYDSDEGRSVAAVITAVQTGTVYETSADMAKKIGTFVGFAKNREPMLKVMRMHRDALKDIDSSKIPRALGNILDIAYEIWDRVIVKGEAHGFRNAQATVMAPTGTIAFMMDCDTTGVEPDAALVKTKLTSEGGSLRIVNQSVGRALRNLGYDERTISSIVSYVEENNTIEGSELLDDHLKIFDCAFRARKGSEYVGKRFISPEGHIKMMASIQPFISGAISKTVNLPHDVTVEEIEKLYIDSWKIGIKAVAVYRDGTKRYQPLSAGDKSSAGSSVKVVEVNKPFRKKLPHERRSITTKFSIADQSGEHEGYLTVGLYDDGTPGEIFWTMSKEGSTLGGLADAFATMTSIALQYGVPLETLIRKFRHQRFDPRGWVIEGIPEIKQADSLIDYIFNYLGIKFFKNGVPVMDNKKITDYSITNNNPEDLSTEDFGGDEELGGFCLTCGSQMIKKGGCKEVCTNSNCGAVNMNGCGGG